MFRSPVLRDPEVVVAEERSTRDRESTGSPVPAHDDSREERQPFDWLLQTVFTVDVYDGKGCSTEVSVSGDFVCV